MLLGERFRFSLKTPRPKPVTPEPILDRGLEWRVKWPCTLRTQGRTYRALVQADERVQVRTWVKNVEVCEGGRLQVVAQVEAAIRAAGGRVNDP